MTLFLVFDRNSTSFQLQFCEFKLGPTSPLFINSRHCQFDSNASYADWEYQRYVWSINSLYVSCDEGELSGPFSIIAFNPKSYQWTRTKYTGMGRAKEMSIDEDEILTVVVREDSLGAKNSKIKTIYRFPMRKPDKLSYIAWFAIRRGALFFESNLYKKILPRLPFVSEFLVFSEYY